MNKVLVLIYGPIDGFPPTINLINEFLDRNYETYAVEVSNKKFKHSKVNLTNLYSLDFAKKIPRIISNYILFFKFLSNVFRISKNNDVKKFVVFDSYSLFAFHLLRTFKLVSSESKVWYHNHDIGYSSDFPIFSLGWIVHKLESKINIKTDFFTLPSIERNSEFKTRECDFVLPNYPSHKLYNNHHSKLNNKVLRLIFQGRITPGHGFESIIELLDKKIGQFELELVFKGIIDENYKKVLTKNLNSEQIKKIVFIGYTDYEEVAEITSNSNIGIAIHKPQSFMHATLGTASNKIYEYVACGLPILFYDNEHFNSYLKKYKWAFAVSDDSTSIYDALSKIVKDYDRISLEAKNSFYSELNYEIFFEKALQIYLAK